MIKPRFDLAKRNAPFHLTEMNQEAVLPSPAADCGGSRRSTGSCCTNGCLHNSLSASRAQTSHAPRVLLPNTLKFQAETFICRDFSFSFSGGLWLDSMSIVHCYPRLARSGSVSALLHTRPSPSSTLPSSLLLPLLLPVTALTVWLHVKAGAFCGSLSQICQEKQKPSVQAWA